MILTLNAEKRNTIKKSDLTNLRETGKIPAVLYGSKMDAVKITIDKAEFTKQYKKSFNEVAFYELSMDGKTYHTLLKDKQIHPVTRNFLHLDFMLVPAESTVEIDMPVKFVGEPIGTKEGGFVDIIQRTVKISCKADQVPEDIELDISMLKVGESKHVRDLPQGSWHVKDAADITLVVVHAKATAPTTPEVEKAPASED